MNTSISTKLAALALALMVNSVIGDFECAYGGFVEAEALATDELHDATNANQGWYLDRRDDNANTNQISGTDACTTAQGSVYTPLSMARRTCGTDFRSIRCSTSRSSTA